MVLAHLALEPAWEAACCSGRAGQVSSRQCLSNWVCWKHLQQMLVNKQIPRPSPLHSKVVDVGDAGICMSNRPGMGT